MPRRPAADQPEATAALYDRLAPSLYRYALMLLADAAAAEDVVHDVFVAMLSRSFDVDTVDAYLRRSVRNACFDRLRRRRVRERITAPEVPLESVASRHDRPEDRLAIERALAALPAEQREVVHLKVFEGCTLREIAALTGESANTVASRYRYAMEKLRAALAAPERS